MVGDTTHGLAMHLAGAYAREGRYDVIRDALARYANTNRVETLRQTLARFESERRR
jgi:hypothetical protein